MKKILILAYRYPPQSGIGSVRPSKLVKYLTADGYSPDVISVCHGSAPDDGVIRIPHGRLAEKLLSRRRTPAAPQAGESLRRKSLASAIKQALRNIIYHYYISLDYYHSFKKYYRAHRSDFKKYDVVLSTASPTAVIFCAQHLKRKLPQVRWICDFRDPLVCPEQFPRWENRINRFLQNRACKDADCVVTVSEGFFARICSERFSDKSYIIPNGFDREDIAEISSVPDTGFSFAYTGVLYGSKRDLSPLFTALNELCSEGKIDIDDISLLYAGTEGTIFKNAAEKSGLGGCVTDLGLVSREESIKLQRSSRFLILATWNTPTEQGVFPGKILEYMVCERPVIALVSGSEPNSEVTKAVERLGLGISCEQARSGDFTKLKEYLLSEYHRFKNGLPPDFSPDRDAVENYSWERLIKKFEYIIEKEG